MWVVYAFSMITVLCDGEGHIVTYALGVRGDKLHAMAARLNQRRRAA